MNKLETIYGDFYQRVIENPEKIFYVRTHKNELTKVNAVCKKETPMLRIGFSDGSQLECGERHVFMSLDGEELFAEDLVVNSRILTLNGSLYVTSIKKSKNNIAYDLSINEPNWYVNDERGIIHHNTGFSLLLAAAYLKAHPSSLILFYDSEFGSPQSYFEANDIDPKRVIHTPIKNIEELKHDLMQQLNGIDREDKVIIIIDSIGNLASIKEVNDALEGKTVADMTRAKQMKSLFRMVTPYLSLLDIPMIAINHTYSEIGLYPKQVMSGGTGPMLSADNVWILGRQQEKDSDGISGYNFIINVEKSRFVKEKSKIAINVTYEKGIQKWSGLFDNAIEGGFILNPNKGWYQIPGDENEKGRRRAEIEFNDDVWETMLKNESFRNYIKTKYQLPINITDDKTTQNEVEEILS